MKHKYDLTILGISKKDKSFFVSISKNWKAANLKEALDRAKTELNEGKYDYDFYNRRDIFDIIIKPSNEIYYSDIPSNVIEYGKPNNKLNVVTNEANIKNYRSLK